MPEGPLHGPESLLSELLLVKTFLMLPAQFSPHLIPLVLASSSWTPGFLGQPADMHWVPRRSQQTPQRPIFPLVGAPLVPHFLPETWAKENH